jgi:xanthine dehydrogenase/oxidase
MSHTFYYDSTQESIAKHLAKVANVAIRNTATIAGNLMLKKDHRKFPSDVFVLLVAVGAKLILRSVESESNFSLQVEEWMRNENMNRKIIVGFAFLPIVAAKHLFR